MDARKHMKSLTTFSGNSDLVRMLVKAQVEFLLVGGLAVEFHKCRDPEKVDDLDLLLNPSVENAERFRGILSSPDLKKLYNLEELYPLPSVSQLAGPNFQMPLKLEPMFCMDFFTPPQDINFSDLYSRGECVLLNGSIPVRVISRADLVERKRRDVQTFSKDKKKHEDDLRCLEAAKRR
jgi:hypothetical protein